MTELTIIDGAASGGTATVPARLEAGAVRLSRGALEQGLGWALRPEGLCRGTACVPVRHAAELESPHGVDLAAVAAALGRPLALDAEEGAAYLGVGADERARSLAALEAPDFTLPDLDGRPHSLAAHRGKTVLLVAYASW